VEGYGLPAVLANEAGSLFGSALIQVQADKVRAVLGKTDCYGFAQAGAGAGYNRDASGDIE
jgi:uncharacterized membrane protein